MGFGQSHVTLQEAPGVSASVLNGKLYPLPLTSFIGEELEE